MAVAPRWTLSRIRARAATEVLARHYQAATPTRRTTGWARNFGDADLTIRPALIELRTHARDLIRNNSWARRGQRAIANNTVGWGIAAKAISSNTAIAKKADQLWLAWAGSTECESEGRHTFASIQHLVMKTIVESGEVLIRRRPRLMTDELTIPLQLQVLEPDFLDHSRTLQTSDSGGPIIQGVEFDKLGRRTAYWLFPQHPGSGRNMSTSKRIPASEVIHVYLPERPGQTRGVSWFAPIILPLKDFDDFEDATLLKQKVASCLAAFVIDQDGEGAPLADASPDAPDMPVVETFEPGMVVQLPPGRDVKIANPPSVTEDAFTARTLRRVASGLGVTYEDLTGDYSQVNFSSSRMARIAHYGNVHDWRWNMLIPMLCKGVWDWAMQAAVLAGELPEAPSAQWTPPPMPMLDPANEGLAYSRLIRNGLMTHDEAVREQGGDPEAHWKEYADGLGRLDQLGIVLDSDARKTSSSGQEQQSVAATAAERDGPQAAAR
jgi:lambda family phage portal protein